MAKIIDCFRHGQSTFNAAMLVSRVDPLHFDARLSTLGETQVREAAARHADDHYELIVISPLTRALQTATGIFGDRETPVRIEALAAERVENSCDIGRRPRELARDFPHLAFDHLDEEWWHRHDAPDHRGICVEPIEHLRGRVERFRLWLAARPEERIAVVGHGTFFFHLTGEVFANCQRVTLRLS